MECYKVYKIENPLLDKKNEENNWVLLPEPMETSTGLQVIGNNVFADPYALSAICKVSRCTLTLKGLNEFIKTYLVKWSLYQEAVRLKFIILNGLNTN